MSSNKELATSTPNESTYVSGDTTTAATSQFTIQSITITDANGSALVADDLNHDIYQISYSTEDPSVVLPDCSTISDGYKATLVNTGNLTVTITVYNTETDKISSWGMTGITGETVDSNSTWNTTPATTFNLPPYMSISLIHLTNVWYSPLN